MEKTAFVWTIGADDQLVMPGDRLRSATFQVAGCTVHLCAHFYSSSSSGGGGEGEKNLLSLELVQAGRRPSDDGQLVADRTESTANVRPADQWWPLPRGGQWTVTLSFDTYTVSSEIKALSEAHSMGIGGGQVGQIVSAFTICCNFTVAEVYIFLFVF
jgi:hypothetical protein